MPMSHGRVTGDTDEQCWIVDKLMISLCTCLLELVVLDDNLDEPCCRQAGAVTTTDRQEPFLSEPRCAK